MDGQADGQYSIQHVRMLTHDKNHSKSATNCITYVNIVEIVMSLRCILVVSSKCNVVDF